MSDWSWASAWPAPAKLNLFLHVVGRRPDGYHLLQTLFRFVDHGDTLRFSPRDDGRIVLATPLPGVPPDQDLTVRAARLLRQAAGGRQGVTISLEKRLPMGGGLGGGSSDAATVLLALNHLWALGLSRDALQALGVTLGADVPVFVFGDNAFAEGVGERLRAVDLPPAWYLVVEPGIEVPTAAIFGAQELRRDTPAMSAEELLARPDAWHNDLQPVAAVRFPAVAAALDGLAAQAPAMMTGSGACVFAAFGSAADAESALSRLPAGTRAWVAAGLPRHPLRDLCR